RASLAQLRQEDDGLPPSSNVPIADFRRLVLTGDVEVALGEIENALKAYPGDLFLLLLRAETLWKSGRTTQAERVCRQILTRQPRALKPRYILGQILSADPERESQGVELIHAIQSDDLAGVVAERLFGESDFSPPKLSRSVVVDLPAHLQPPR